MVKCATCGLIGRQDSDGMVHEVDDLTRQEGDLVSGGKQRAELGVPFCYVASVEFTPPDNCYDEALLVESLHREHASPRWRAWSPGKSPKEHEEMVGLEELRTRQLLAEEKAERLRREDIERSAKLRQEDIALSTRRNRQTLAVAIVGIVLSIVVPVLTQVVMHYLNRWLEK